VGIHRGYRVTWRRGAWLAEARDPARQGYESKRFHPEKDPLNTKTAATEWAKTRHAELRARRRIAQVKERTAELVTRYLAELERVGRVEEHRKDVKRILTKLAIAVPDITTPAAERQTMDWLRTFTALAVVTRNRYLFTLKAFATWLMAPSRGFLVRDPFAGIEPEKPPQRLPEQFTIDELRKLTAKTDDPYHRRWCVLLYAGMREDEADTLTWSRVDMEGRVLQVIGKGNKERLIPIQPELHALLAQVPKEARTGLVCGLPTIHSWREFQAFIARHKVPRDGRSPHSLRHCYAGLMTATGVPSILLQAYMGHTTQSTTAGYATMATRYVAVVSGWKRGEFHLVK